MGLQFIPARLVPWEINTGTEGTPNWVDIKGLDGSAWPTPEVEEMDTTDNDSGGIYSSVPIEVKRKVTLKGFIYEDPDTGARDAGQEACEAASPDSGNMGYNTLKQFRYTTPGGTATVRKGWCRAGATDGGRNDKLGWECEISFVE
ncbi:MAG: hypothetical protein IBX61_09235 [Thermoleophilia bacterium]|nr:hypothetical protein [Thermoleophilia bacterium]